MFTNLGFLPGPFVDALRRSASTVKTFGSIRATGRLPSSTSQQLDAVSVQDGNATIRYIQSAGAAGSLFSPEISVSASGTERVKATFGVKYARVEVAGQVSPGGTTLSGSASFTVPVPAGAYTQTATSAAVCKAEQSYNATLCGTSTVQSAAQCGVDTITSGALCGVEWITDPLCGIKWCKKAFIKYPCGYKSCSRDRSCDVPRTCTVPNDCANVSSCTWTVNNPSAGSIRGTLDAQVSSGGVNVGVGSGGGLQYCTDQGSCAGVSYSFNGSAQAPEICVPGLPGSGIPVHTNVPNKFCFSL